MNTEIRVLVQNQYFSISRELFLRETENKQLKNTKQMCLSMPQWVTKQTYLLLVQYLQTGCIHFLNKYLQDNQLVIKLLRTSDYLGLTKFQDRFINELLISSINLDNCLIFLDESHRKLKSMENSQSWFKLLNEGISYLSKNLFQIYKINPQKLKSLNQKIMNEVLDIVIRQQRKNAFKNQHILFQLITQCKAKHAKGPQNICKYLRSMLLHKKIVPKIHAKLSWKLEKMQEITAKKTKVFKFLDYKWYLSADNSSEGLLVTLNLIPYQESSDTASQFSDATKSQTNGGTQSHMAAEPENHEQIIKNDKYTKIGIFYSKVLYKTQQLQNEKQIKIYYISLTKPMAIPIINLDKKLQSQIGTGKVELTIFYNLDLIYTYVNNYILSNFECLNYKGRDFCMQELQNMIENAKISNQFTKSLRLTNQYLYTYGEKCAGQSQKLFSGYDFSEMTKIQIEIYENLKQSFLTNKKSQQNDQLNRPFSEKNQNQSPQINQTANMTQNNDFHQQMPINYRKTNNTIIVQNPNYLNQQQQQQHKKDAYKNFLAISPIDSVAKKVSVDKDSSSFKKQTSHEKVITGTTNKEQGRLSNYFQDSKSIYFQTDSFQKIKDNFLRQNENKIAMSQENQQRLFLNTGLKRTGKLDEHSYTSSLNNSLNNSRTNSKRKIFNKPKSSYEKGEMTSHRRSQNDELDPDKLMEQIIRVTDFSNFMKNSIDPFLANSIREVCH